MKGMVYRNSLQLYKNISLFTSLTFTYYNSYIIFYFNRRQFNVHCLDVVGNCLGYLYTRHDSNELVQQFRGIQAKLERLESQGKIWTYQYFNDASSVKKIVSKNQILAQASTDIVL